MKKVILKLNASIFMLFISVSVFVENSAAWTKFTATSSSSVNDFGAEAWMFFKNNILGGAGGSIVGVGGILVAMFFIGRTMIPQALVTLIAIVGFFKAEALATALGMCI